MFQMVTGWVSTKVIEGKEKEVPQIVDLVLALHHEQLLTSREVEEGLREPLDILVVSYRSANHMCDKYTY